MSRKTSSPETTCTPIGSTYRPMLYGICRSSESSFYTRAVKMSTALFVEVVEGPLSRLLVIRTGREDDRITGSDLSLSAQVPPTMDEVWLTEDAKSTDVLVATKTNEVQHLHLHNKKGLGDFHLRGLYPYV